MLIANFYVISAALPRHTQALRRAHQRLGEEEIPDAFPELAIAVLGCERFCEEGGDSNAALASHLY
jgi:hypothetical protein